MPAPTTRPDGSVLAAVAAGGVGGSLGRYAVSLALPPGLGFPWATFLVNVSGSFAMGLLVAWLDARPGAHRLARPLLGVGVLGGWTTFSAFAVDVVRLSEAGRAGLAGGYVVSSVLVAVLALAAGGLVGRRLWPAGAADVAELDAAAADATAADAAAADAAAADTAAVDAAAADVAGHDQGAPR